MTTVTTDRLASRDLILDRVLAAPRAAVWRCWTEPDLLMRWFTPAPWTTHDAVLDLRPGGRFSMVMRGPDGEVHPNEGVYLEVTPGERLVFTDAYSRAWEPSAAPFFTGAVSFADADGGVRYVAEARHWSAEDCARHEAMGFHEGWGKAADQLEAVARGL